MGNRKPFTRPLAAVFRELTRAADGGAEGNRTPDLDIANVALSQLSYGPTGPGCGKADNVGGGAILSSGRAVRRALAKAPQRR